MGEDYRNTRYCPKLVDLDSKKRKVVCMIKRDHHKAIDMHKYLSKNNEKYKTSFMEAYNYKCAYCGVSINLINKEAFEIDHFIFKEAPRFKTKKDAGYIENLVLACHDCNHKKSSFLIPDNEAEKLHPDKEEISKAFYRDNLYYIQMSDGAKKNKIVTDFYKQLDLGAQVHRLDYLLMNLKGFNRKHEENKALGAEIGKIIDILQLKRNLL